MRGFDCFVLLVLDKNARLGTPSVNAILHNSISLAIDIRQEIVPLERAIS
jgi:hypothetical protein